MNKVINYFKESYEEIVQRVTWPTWSNLQQSTLIVISATLVITLIIWLMEKVAGISLNGLYSIFGK